MLTNMENQLREQGAVDKFEQVLEEIPRVREDLGFIPLVTPTSQIVGTQAVMNVLSGERYKSISKETRGVLRGEYGATAAPVNAELQKQVLEGDAPITVRPADLIDNELESLTEELKAKAKEQNIALAKNEIDDVLTYALFPQIGLKFLKNRGNPDAFEPVPQAENTASGASQPAAVTSAKNTGEAAVYDVKIDGKVFTVEVAPSGQIVTTKATTAASEKPAVSGGHEVKAPLAGNVFKVQVKEGQAVKAGDVLIILEAMKMETDIRAEHAGTVAALQTKEGDSVNVGDVLLTLE